MRKDGVMRKRTEPGAPRVPCPKCKGCGTVPLGPTFVELWRYVLRTPSTWRELSEKFGVSDGLIRYRVGVLEEAGLATHNKRDRLIRGLDPYNQQGG